MRRHPPDAVDKGPRAQRGQGIETTNGPSVPPAPPMVKHGALPLADLPTWLLRVVRGLTAAGAWCWWWFAAIHAGCETELARREGRL